MRGCVSVAGKKKEKLINRSAAILMSIDKLHKFIFDFIGASFPSISITSENRLQLLKTVAIALPSCAQAGSGFNAYSDTAITTARLFISLRTRIIGPFRE